MKRNQIINRMLLAALLGIVSEAVAMQEGSSSSSEISKNKVEDMYKRWKTARLAKDPTQILQEEKNLFENFKTETPEIQSEMLWYFGERPSLFTNFFNEIKDKKSIPPFQGYTLLHYAVLANDSAVVKRLLEQEEAAVHAKDNDGNTPLHLAARHCGAGILNQLKMALANINVKNGFDSTPLHHAAGYGNLEAVRWLLEQTNLEKDSQDEFGKTELHKAVGNPFIVEELLKAGCNPILADNNHGTPLDAAQSLLDLFQTFEGKEYLLERKKDLLKSIKLLKSPSSSSSSIN